MFGISSLQWNRNHDLHEDAHRREFALFAAKSVPALVDYRK
jgi:hypothetical protein